MLLLFLLIALLIYSNSRLAKKKNKSPLLWGFITSVVFFLAFFLLGSIYLAIVYKGPLAPESLSAYLKNDPFAFIMLLLLGVGGGLIVRFILERIKESGPA